MYAISGFNGIKFNPVHDSLTTDCSFSVFMLICFIGTVNDNSSKACQCFFAIKKGFPSNFVLFL